MSELGGSRVDGVVSRVDHGVVTVDVAVQKGCGRCDEPGGCGGGLAVGGPACSRSYQLTDALGVRAGDEVILTVPAGGVLRAAGWAYGMPLLLGLVGAVAAASLAGDDDRLAVAGGLGGLILGFVALRLFRGRLAAPSIAMEFKHPQGNIR